MRGDGGSIGGNHRSALGGPGAVLAQLVLRLEADLLNIEGVHVLQEEAGGEERGGAVQVQDGGGLEEDVGVAGVPLKDEVLRLLVHGDGPRYGDHKLGTEPIS